VQRHNLCAVDKPPPVLSAVLASGSVVQSVTACGCLSCAYDCCCGWHLLTVVMLHVAAAPVVCDLCLVLTPADICLACCMLLLRQGSVTYVWC
jgi:hypothetical protein